MRFIFVSLLFSSLYAIDYPDQFQIRQDMSERKFQILDQRGLLGTVVGTSYGELDCYDTNGEKQWVNWYDDLYDRSGLIASVHVQSDDAWFTEETSGNSSTRIELFDAAKVPLAVFQAVDSDRKLFVVLDAAAGMTLATARWDRQNFVTGMPPNVSKMEKDIRSYMYDQEWSVMIVDRKIPVDFIVLALLKHSQKYLPGIYSYGKFDEMCSIRHPKGFITAKECKGVVEVLDGQFVLSLPHGVVVNEGGIVTGDGKILRDTETFQEDQHKLLLKGRDIAGEDPIYFDGKLAVVSSPGQENWYHWLLQVLPRLKILADSGVAYDKIYIDNLYYPWQKESLAIVLEELGIPRDRLFLREGDAIVQAKTLIVPSIPHNPSKNPGFPEWLQIFLQQCFLREGPAYDRLYISRSLAKVRRIANEGELVAVLKQKGFTVLHLEEMSPFAQAAVFHNAKIIIGPHGSGFANLIFSKPGTQVIEIDHGLVGEEQRSYYKYFAKLTGCSYHPFYIDLVEEEGLEDDIVIDLSNFMSFIKSIL